MVMRNVQIRYWESAESNGSNLIIEKWEASNSRELGSRVSACDAFCFYYTLWLGTCPCAGIYGSTEPMPAWQLRLPFHFLKFQSRDFVWNQLKHSCDLNVCVCFCMLYVMKSKYTVIPYTIRIHIFTKQKWCVKRFLLLQKCQHTSAGNHRSLAFSLWSCAAKKVHFYLLLFDCDRATVHAMVNDHQCWAAGTSKYQHMAYRTVWN